MAEPIRIESRRLVLRTMNEGDRVPIVLIRQSPEVKRWWQGEDLSAEFDEDLNDEHAHQLALETVEGSVIGLVQFEEETEPNYRHATIDIFVDPVVHGKGYGSEAIQALCDYLFDERGHHRLTIDPAADNVAAISCYSKVGFQKVGRLRHYERRTDDTWADGLLMEMLASDRPAT